MDKMTQMSVLLEAIDDQQLGIVVSFENKKQAYKSLKPILWYPTDKTTLHTHTTVLVFQKQVAIQF